MQSSKQNWWNTNSKSIQFDDFVRGRSIRVKVGRRWSFQTKMASRWRCYVICIIRVFGTNWIIIWMLKLKNVLQRWFHLTTKFYGEWFRFSDLGLLQSWDSDKFQLTITKFEWLLMPRVIGVQRLLIRNMGTGDTLHFKLNALFIGLSCSTEFTPDVRTINHLFSNQFKSKIIRDLGLIFFFKLIAHTRPNTGRGELM